MKLKHCISNQYISATAILQMPIPKTWTSKHPRELTVCNSVYFEQPKSPTTNRKILKMASFTSIKPFPLDSKLEANKHLATKS